MPFDYGTVYGSNTTDPVNSHVYLSWMVSGTNAVYQSQNPVPYTDVRGNYACFVEDDSNAIEFGYIVSGQLKTYNVNLGNTTGTASISLTNSMSVPTGTNTWIYGIRKVNSNLYNTYYLVINTSNPSLYSFDFRKVATIPSGTSTDTSIQRIDVSVAAGDSVGYDWKTILSRNGYLAITHYYLDGADLNIRPNHVDTGLYQLNMDTDSVGLIGTISLPNIDQYSHYVAYPIIMETLGSLRWGIYYELTTYNNFFPYSAATYSVGTVFNGVTSSVYSLAYQTLIRKDVYPLHYNYRDTKLTVIWTFVAITYYVSIDITGAISVYNTALTAPTLPPITFSSETVFPKIGDNGSTFYWLDNNGNYTTPISLTGVSIILNIYPTLDTISGGIYVTAIMNDSSFKLLMVDSGVTTILKQWTITNFPAGGSYHGSYYLPFNHGNFFMGFRTSSTSFVTAYLCELPNISGVGEVQMIVEKN